MRKGDAPLHPQEPTLHFYKENHMEKHLLIAVGDDLSSLHGIRFVTSFFVHKEEIKLTLFNITPTPYSPEPEKIERTGFKATIVQMDTSDLSKYPSLQTSQTLLLNRGFPAKNITIKLMTKRSGTVRDIVHEGKKGKYDAIILGRRGYNIFEQALATSVSREMLEQEIGFPLWICRRVEEGRKNVLLCVDETEPSMRIADHVGFVLQDVKEHSVTLFYVDEGGGNKAETVLEQARKKLKENGVEEERVTSRVVYTAEVPKAILSEAERGAYAVVAMGRGGKQPQGFLRRWLIGSRSLKVMEELEKSVLWLSK